MRRLLHTGIFLLTAIPPLVTYGQMQIAGAQAIGAQPQATNAQSRTNNAQIQLSNALPLTDPNTGIWEAIGLSSQVHFPAFTRPVKVAIIDDGFDIDNPVWQSHIAHNNAEIPGNAIDDDHNGKADDWEGWDFGDEDADVRPGRNLLDKESHGTRVLGVFWEALQRLSAQQQVPASVTLLPIKAVSDVKQNNYLKEGYRGIEYAISQHADVIICSWSGPLISAEERAILEKARSRGVIIIASAGNFYAMQPMYPGAIPSVINVAAVDRAGRKLRTSNYGMFVDISAPADSIITYEPYRTIPSSRLSATSAAAPVVAAIITGLRSAFPNLSPDAIERLIKNTATPLDGRNLLYAGNLGAGMINVTGILDALGYDREAQVISGPAMAKAGAIAARTVSPRHTYLQPKAYIDLQKLTTDVPIRIAPEGHYRNIKFLAQLSSLTSQPDILVRTYKSGHSTDSVIRNTSLRRPFLVSGDSIDLLRASDRQFTAAGITAMAGAPTTGVRGSGTAGSGTTGAARAWLYYEVTTIDSSFLYCGGSITETGGTEGYVEDGSGPLPYSGRNDCKWLITVPAGKKVRIGFPQFDTEPKLDQVYIFNGASTKDPILAIFSGHKIPPVVTSWGNVVLIWWLSSEENNFQGWQLHFKAVDP